MTSFKGPQSSQPKQASEDCGNAYIDDNKIPIGANLTTADEVILIEIPAGVRLSSLKYRNSDFDTGTTLAFNLGYRSLHPDQQVAPSASYFLAASTAMQAAQATWVEIPFDAITFNEPVQIVLKPTASATGLPAAGSIWVQAEGKILGVV